jgi:hypothetical protein
MEVQEPLVLQAFPLDRLVGKFPYFGDSYIAPVHFDVDSMRLSKCAQAFDIDQELRQQQSWKQGFQGLLRSHSPIRLWGADQRFMAPMSQQKGHEAEDQPPIDALTGLLAKPV